jgi:Cu(I)/Ag(I) efflux system membrane fusion protein
MRGFNPLLLTALGLYVLLGGCQKAPPTEGRKILYYRDPMHPSYRAERPGIAPDCHMELTPVYADETANESSAGQRVVRVSNRQAAAIGLRTEAAREDTGSTEVRTVGRVQAQESRIYQVSAGADGWIRHVYGGESGAFVSRGQALGAYYSRDIASPQQGYLYAADSVERVAASKSATKEQRVLAEKQLEQARDALAFLGLSERQITGLEQSRREERDVMLSAPAAGVILERRTAEGARFAKGDVLWVVADLSSVWIAADVFPEDLAALGSARTATIVLPGGLECTADIDPSLPQFDADQRVAKLRLTMKNKDRQLLPGMTLAVLIRKPLSRGLTVSAESVIESGIKPRVFVQRGDGGLEARAVTTGWSSAGRVQILSGLRAGEQVVSAGAFLIDSESRMMQGAQ